MGDFFVVFSDLPDPRAENARHDLLELLFIALASTLCGGEGCVDMAEFAAAKEDMLREFLVLEHGLPSHDTFSRLFRALDPEAFEACFRRFMADFTAADTGVIALDGKMLRRSFDRAAGRSPLNMVTAFASEAGLALGQKAVPAGTNEIGTVQEMLGLLDLAGRTVTMDAMHCQLETARLVLDGGGDYVMALKGNQPDLRDELRLFMHDPEVAPASCFEEADKTGGRVELRRAEVYDDLGWMRDCGLVWPGLAAIGKIEARREIGQKIEAATRYYLLSSPMPAKAFSAAVRSHWAIENSLHWVLDVVMNEDQARNRKDNAAQNHAALRRLGLNLIKNNKSKGSIRTKIKRAGWDNKFLLSLFTKTDD